MDKNREELLKKTLGDINKRFGKGTVMTMQDKEITPIEVIPTGSFLLDKALGVGGWPRGRIIEIYGIESAGKSTLALHAIAEVQKQGGVGAMIDVEHALDPVYAKALGVNVDDMIISQPDCGEDALEIAESLIRSGAVDIVVIDSVAALTPRAEIEGEMGDAHVGLLARLMSQCCRKITAAVSKTNCVCMFVNQVREKVGIAYGNPEVTSGGRALKFYSSVRVELRKGDTLKNGADMYGHQLKAKIVKNKVAPPFKSATMTVVWGKGIDIQEEILTLAIEDGIIEKSGSWLTYKDERIQGRENMKNYFVTHPEEFEELKALVMKTNTNTGVDDFSPSDEDMDEGDAD